MEEQFFRVIFEEQIGGIGKIVESIVDIIADSEEDAINQIINSITWEVRILDVKKISERIYY